MTTLYIQLLASLSMNKLLLFFLTLISSVSIADGFHELEFEEPDHLVPDRSVYAEPFLMDYYLMVSGILSPNESELLRALVFPSFSPEYAISIMESEESYVIEVRQPEKSYWGYKTLEFKKKGSSKILKDGKFQRDNDGIAHLEKEYPISPSELSINTCTKPLDKSITSDLLRVFERELFRVRHADKDSGGLDGTKYHYSMRRGLRMLSGQTWSPNDNLPTGKLVAISDSLYEYCFKGISNKKVKIAIKEAR